MTYSEVSPVPLSSRCCGFFLSPQPEAKIPAVDSFSLIFFVCLFFLAPYKWNHAVDIALGCWILGCFQLHPSYNTGQVGFVRLLKGCCVSAPCLTRADALRGGWCREVSRKLCVHFLWIEACSRNAERHLRNEQRLVTWRAGGVFEGVAVEDPQAINVTRSSCQL